MVNLFIFWQYISKISQKGVKFNYFQFIDSYFNRYFTPQLLPTDILSLLINFRKHLTFVICIEFILKIAAVGFLHLFLNQLYQYYLQMSYTFLSNITQLNERNDCNIMKSTNVSNN